MIKYVKGINQKMIHGDITNLFFICISVVAVKTGYYLQIHHDRMGFKGKPRFPLLLDFTESAVSRKNRI